MLSLLPSDGQSEVAVHSLVSHMPARASGVSASTTPLGDGVVASRLEVVEISEVTPAMSRPGARLFTAAECAYAESKSDPQRRLAARLAAGT